MAMYNLVEHSDNYSKTSEVCGSTAKIHQL